MDGLNTEPTVEVLYAAGADVAEGPFYEKETDSLLWVDILKKTINLYDLKTNQNRFLQFSDSPGAVIPLEGCSQLVTTLHRKICLVDRDTGEVVKVLATVQEDRPGNRFNDCKCDSSGRLWCGTMGPMSSPGVLEPDQGMLFSYSAGSESLKEHVVATASNGLDWNGEDNIMYFIDTYPKHLYSFAYDSKTGALSNKQVCIDYGQYSELGFPDGMCVDSKGRLWVASFGGQWGVTCWDPVSKERLLTVKIPGARNITSCCFGGPNYKWLFVTSATYGASEEELAQCPNAGALFVVKDLGASGTPAHKFKPGP